MPVIVFDSYDCAGKTTLAKRLSKTCGIPMYLAGASQRPEFRSNHEHKLWAQSAYNHLSRILCSGIDMTMIVDRWMFTEYCYAPVLRGYDVKDYYKKIEETLAPTGKLIWIYPHVNNAEVLKYRYVKKKEEFLTFKNLLKIRDIYDGLFSSTKFPGMSIATDNSKVDECVNTIRRFVECFTRSNKGK